MCLVIMSCYRIDHNRTLHPLISAYKYHVILYIYLLLSWICCVAYYSTNKLSKQLFHSFCFRYRIFATSLFQVPSFKHWLLYICHVVVHSFIYALLIVYLLHSCPFVHLSVAYSIFATSLSIRSFKYCLLYNYLLHHCPFIHSFFLKIKKN